MNSTPLTRITAWLLGADLTGVTLADIWRVVFVLGLIGSLLSQRDSRVETVSSYREQP
jgi:hypothetical protein